MKAASEDDPQEVPESKWFTRESGSLCIDGVPFALIAEEVGTPTYVYSQGSITENYQAVVDAMGELPHLVAYAIKANGNLTLLRHLASLGCGADIVSGGELWRATTAGIVPSKIVFSGVGKRDEEIAAALDVGIRAIHVESIPELDRIEAIAGRKKQFATIALRVNPDVDAKTHPYIATGLHDTKFGLEIPAARALLGRIQESSLLKLEGVACHIGSQLETTAPLTEAVEILARFAQECVASGAPLRSIDVGGGWPMAYGNEHAPYPSYNAFGDAIREGLREAPKDLEVITEPGRALVGDAGALLTRVIYVKEPHSGEGGHRFVIVDGAMTELIRPALYEAYHAVDLVEVREGETKRADVVGPVCESGDFLALGRDLPPVERGDLVVIRGAGAYGREMASAYNARPPAAEVLASDGEFRLVRKRATVESLAALER